MARLGSAMDPSCVGGSSVGSVEQLGGRSLVVVLGHTSSSPCRAVYGSSHRNPDSPVQRRATEESLGGLIAQYAKQLAARPHTMPAESKPVCC